jgi:hypothetical protein
MNDTINDKQSTESGGAVDKPAVMCCAVFEDMAKRFSWMGYEANGQRLACMPHIYGSNGERWRVNYCPSCGREVRSIEVPLDLLA